MRVRAKLTLTFLALTLAPLWVIGTVEYRRGERALRDSLGGSYQRMAAEAIDKVDRGLLAVQERVRLWVGLELMQEVVTGDLDGRISSFLMAVGRESAAFASVEVMDARGEVVASSVPTLTGSSQRDDESFRRARAGARVVRDVHRDERLGASVVSFCQPIRAAFDETQVIGVLCARWDAGELRAMTEGPRRGRAAAATTLVMTGAGLAISAPASEGAPALAGNLIERGLRSALLASRGEEGHVVERLPGVGEYLVGYSPSRGRLGFPGLGWSALVVEDLDLAFAPIQQLKLIIAGAGAITALGAVILSLGISHRLTTPLVRMAEVAKRVARGDFEGRVGYRSKDEIGTLAAVFDGMTADLARQRAQLVADMERRERAEADATSAKEAAEESSTRLSAVLDTMGEGIITLDSAGAIVMVNQEVSRTWGYEQQELIGRDVKILMDGPEGARHDQGYFRHLAAGEPGGKRRLETEGRRRDGSRFPLEMVVATTRIGGRQLATAAVQDITERKRAEEQIRASLQEKEVLLKEIHHRVKNNLQVITSLLSLQSEHIRGREVVDVFKDSESRVRSMALIHEMLYRSRDLSRIDVEEYLRTLSRDLLSSYGRDDSKVALRLEVQPIALGMDTAIHCGLLVNELLSNALKYAFPDGRGGEVRIELGEEGAGRYRLVIADDGVGLPPELGFPGTQTLGLQLVSMLVAHLEGSIEVSARGGTRFEVRFRDVDRPEEAARG